MGVSIRIVYSAFTQPFVQAEDAKSVVHARVTLDKSRSVIGQTFLALYPQQYQGIFRATRGVQAVNVDWSLFKDRLKDHHKIIFGKLPEFKGEDIPSRWQLEKKNPDERDELTEKKAQAEAENTSQLLRPFLGSLVSEFKRAHQSLIKASLELDGDSVQDPFEREKAHLLRMKEMESLLISMQEKPTETYQIRDKGSIQLLKRIFSRSPKGFSGTEVTNAYTVPIDASTKETLRSALVAGQKSLDRFRLARDRYYKVGQGVAVIKDEDLLHVAIFSQEDLRIKLNDAVHNLPIDLKRANEHLNYTLDKFNIPPTKRDIMQKLSDVVHPEARVKKEHSLDIIILGPPSDGPDGGPTGGSASAGGATLGDRSPMHTEAPSVVSRRSERSQAPKYRPPPRSSLPPRRPATGLDTPSSSTPEAPAPKPTPRFSDDQKADSEDPGWKTVQRKPRKPLFRR